MRYFFSPIMVSVYIFTQLSIANFVYGQTVESTAKPAPEDVLGCVIKPSDVVTIGSSADGIIAEVPVDLGETVAPGQVVVRISSGVEKASVELAKVRANDKSAVEHATLIVALKLDRKERAEKLFQTALESRENYIQLRKEYEIAEVELKQALLDVELAKLEQKRSEAVLELRTIRSPTAGLVTERKKSVGEYAEIGDEVLTIAKLDPLHVEAFLPLKYWGHVHKGQKVNVVARGLEMAPLPAEIDAVVRIFDAASGTFGIRLRIPNPENTTPAGLWCDLVF